MPAKKISQRDARRDHWAVSVDRNGQNLVVIESNCLSGKPSFTPDEEQCIRDCAAHLLAFIGQPKDGSANQVAS